METPPLFNAKNRAYWIVDGTTMTLITDADIPLGRIRRAMLDDLAAAARFELALQCIHWSDSFQNVCGTQIHGHGWLLHKLRATGGLWEQADLASHSDWTEVQIQTATEKTPPKETP
jgi:hypothetical protein